MILFTFFKNIFKFVIYVIVTELINTPLGYYEIVIIYMK